MWRRLPTYFPNIRLSMLPLSEAQKQQLKDCGWLREVAFKTEPRVNKFEIKAYFEAVHGMDVESVSTINYQGKRKRNIDEKGRAHYRRMSDWKKAYVIFRPPQDKLEEWQTQKQKQLEEQKQQWQQQQQLQKQRWKHAKQGLLPPAARAAAQAAEQAEQQRQTQS